MDATTEMVDHEYEILCCIQEVSHLSETVGGIYLAKVRVPKIAAQ